MVMVSLCMVLVNCSNIEFVEKIENNGFRWYEIKQNGFYGALDVNRKTLIPLKRKYDFVFYVSTYEGWFYVEKNGKSGACDNEGKEIIAPIKYERLSYRNEDGKEFFYAVLDGETGICEKNGDGFNPCEWWK